MHRSADDRYEHPVTVDLLADLQAGLLDDRTAAQLRRRIRTDPAVKAQLAALDRVRHHLSLLGGDFSSAPDVPADVTTTISAALRSAPPPARGDGSRA